MRCLKWLHRERGQAFMLLVLGMTVVFVGGVIAVDIGLWISERRGAQKDADATSLAGAWELLNPLASEADAVDAATANLGANNQQGNASFALPVKVDDSCFEDRGKLDAVTTDINHGTKSLFASIFDIVAPVPGAHAKACAGAANGMGGVLPFEIDDDPGPCFDDNERPKFTAFCPIEFGARGGNPRGILDLQAPGDYCSDGRGAGDIAQLIEYGATGTCLINEGEPPSCDPARNGPWYDCVSVQTGNPKKVLDGVNRRVSKDGLCDANFGDGDGVDEFEESVIMVFDSGDPFTSIYEARDCDPGQEGKQISPRLATIIVLEEEPPPGNAGHPIDAFAGVYLLGCTKEGVDVTSQAQTDADCNAPGGGNDDDDGDTGPPGHSVVWARFVNLIVTNAGVGQPDSATTIFGITLVE